MRMTENSSVLINKMTENSSVLINKVFVAFIKSSRTIFSL